MTVRFQADIAVRGHGTHAEFMAMQVEPVKKPYRSERSGPEKAPPRKRVVPFNDAPPDDTEQSLFLMIGGAGECFPDLGLILVRKGQKDETI